MILAESSSAQLTRGSTEDDHKPFQLLVYRVLLLIIRLWPYAYGVEST